MSALYSIASIVARLYREGSLENQVATLNRSESSIAWIDLVYQCLGIAASLAPVALVFYLVWGQQGPRLQALGLDFGSMLKDSLWGVSLAALIGIPGLGLYLAGRQLGLSVTVIPSNLGDYWWSIPILVVSALRAGLLEEVIAVGYLFSRLKLLNYSTGRIVILQSLLRATYHLYQGFSAFIGNFVMGLVFGGFFARTRRLVPLILGHVLIDIVAFVGYPIAVRFIPGF
tara:strand:- start:90 stop:776 length:687 start_codon:yes stop_codon:yes gene_type:complete